jgi:hypothetical protein
VRFVVVLIAFRVELPNVAIRNPPDLPDLDHTRSLVCEMHSMRDKPPASLSVEDCLPDSENEFNTVVIEVEWLKAEPARNPWCGVHLWICGIGE